MNTLIMELLCELMHRIRQHASTVYSELTFCFRGIPTLLRFNQQMRGEEIDPRR